MRLNNSLERQKTGPQAEPSALGRRKGRKLEAPGIHTDCILPPGLSVTTLPLIFPHPYMGIPVINIFPIRVLLCRKLCYQI